MKKLLFLLSLLFVSVNVIDAATCCPTTKTCATKCTTTKKCKKACLPEHGKTYRRLSNAFQNATPVYVSMFNSNVIRNLDADDKHGGFEVTVFGGRSVRQADAACYFFPCGHTEYTFDGSVADTLKTHAGAFSHTKVVGDAKAEGAIADNAATNFTLEVSGPSSTTSNLDNFDVKSNPLTLKFDSNKDTSKILPWNFGITFAALFEPFGAAANSQFIGGGLVTNPAFKSTIAPTYQFSHVGAGLALRYHFSDDKNGFWGSLSTSVEHVRSRMCLNETSVKDKTEINATNFPTSDDPFGGVTITSGVGQLFTTNDSNATQTATTATNPKGSINAAYLNGTVGTGFPVDGTVTNGGGVPPKNVEEAFNQDSWKYGKIGCEQTKTRLADIELAIGYQWMCGDCASTNWYLGVVIPTGNKPCADYVAPAVVGNGQHAGIMGGSSLELMFSENEDRSIWYRLDTNCRFLFRNTQKRSFDLCNNEWSRYMMVWENEEAYKAAIAKIDAASTPFPAQRSYEPGINVFTHDMKVKPRFQTRINQAVYFQSECFRAELGWNLLARSKECVEFSCPWDKKPAFADSSYVGGVALNNHRTIHNDAQLMSVNAVGRLADIAAASPNKAQTLAAGSLEGTVSSGAVTPADSVLASRYTDFAILEADVNLDSAATPATIVHAPYLSLGYGWDSDWKPAVSVGASYEFSQSNVALNKWMVWGKFEFAF